MNMVIVPRSLVFVYRLQYFGQGRNTQFETVQNDNNHRLKQL
jgi:hypothetical protein